MTHFVYWVGYNIAIKVFPINVNENSLVVVNYFWSLCEKRVFNKKKKQKNKTNK